MGWLSEMHIEFIMHEWGKSGPVLKAGYGQNYILCMACFCSEDSRGDDRRAKFSLVYEIGASRARQ